MLKKRFTSLLLALVMVLGLSGQAVALESPFANELFLDAELTQNADLMNQVFGPQAQPLSLNANAIQIEISNSKTSVQVHLHYCDLIYDATLVGTFEEVTSAQGAGYVGVYAGSLIPTEGNEEAIPAIADITFNDTDAFIALTLGDYTNGNMPSILFFGEMSDSLGRIASNYSSMSIGHSDELTAESKSYESGVRPYSEAYLDTSWFILDNAAVVAGSYQVGNACIMGQKAFENGSDCPVVTKVNASKDNFKEHLVNDLGYQRVTIANNSVYLDQVTTSISTKHVGLYIYSYAPQNAEKSFSIFVPVAMPNVSTIGALLGSPTVSLPITTSSTTVESNASVRPTQVNWTFYKRSGWTDSEVVGTAGSNSGIPAEVDLKYSGAATSTLTVGVSSTTSLRFAYGIDIGTSIVTLHLSASPRTLNASITLYPSPVG